jgi:hypothetical protein
MTRVVPTTRSPRARHSILRRGHVAGLAIASLSLTLVACQSPRSARSPVLEADRVATDDEAPGTGTAGAGENAAGTGDRQREPTGAADLRRPDRESIQWAGNDAPSGQGSPSLEKPPSAAVTTAGGEAPPASGATGIEPVDLQSLAVQLSRELYADAAYADMPMPQLLTIASMSIAMPDRPFDADAFPDLTDRERELLAAFHAFCADLGRSLGDTQDPEVLAERVDTFRQAISDEPELLIPQAVMCTRVEGFGKFETFERNSFMVGVEQPVVVYAEIQQHHAELNDLDEWVTRLTMKLEIWDDASGIPVWSTPGETVVEKSRNQIRDFFLAQIVRIPEVLTVGRFTLKIRITDEATGAEAETGIPFTLVADASLAAR